MTTTAVRICEQCNRPVGGDNAIKLGKAESPDRCKACWWESVQEGKRAAAMMRDDTTASSDPSRFPCGHLRTEVNTRVVRSKGHTYRHCRACANLAQRDRAARRQPDKSLLSSRETARLLGHDRQEDDRQEPPAPVMLPAIPPVALHACPRCRGGALRRETDLYGNIMQACVNCGYEREVRIAAKRLERQTLPMAMEAQG